MPTKANSVQITAVVSLPYPPRVSATLSESKKKARITNSKLFTD